jgi:hypothetical protein
LPHESNARRNFMISTLRFQMRRNCQRINVKGIPQNESTQLQHPWYLSDFTIYLPNEMSTEFNGNKHCVPPNTWKTQQVTSFWYHITDLFCMFSFITIYHFFQIRLIFPADLKYSQKYTKSYFKG